MNDQCPARGHPPPPDDHPDHGPLGDLVLDALRRTTRPLYSILCQEESLLYATLRIAIDQGEFCIWRENLDEFVWLVLATTNPCPADSGCCNRDHRISPMEYAAYLETWADREPFEVSDGFVSTLAGTVAEPENKVA